jgi:hypothetical protein
MPSKVPGNSVRTGWMIVWWHKTNLCPRDRVRYKLWSYGHIVEASEQYEIIANLIAISQGERFQIIFPPRKTRSGAREQTPGEKIKKIDEMAQATRMASVSLPLKEIWNRDLRNAIFHSDYVIFGGLVRTVKPMAEYTNDQIMILINKAFAYHFALTTLFQIYRSAYTKPKSIDVHPGFSNLSDEKAVVIVREGFGVIGLKDGWSAEQIRRGAIPWRFGRFTPEESDLMDHDPTREVFPAKA